MPGAWASIKCVHWAHRGVDVWQGTQTLDVDRATSTKPSTETFSSIHFSPKFHANLSALFVLSLISTLVIVSRAYSSAVLLSFVIAAERCGCLLGYSRGSLGQGHQGRYAFIGHYSPLKTDFGLILWKQRVLCRCPVPAFVFLKLGT